MACAAGRRAVTGALAAAAPDAGTLVPRAPDAGTLVPRAPDAGTLVRWAPDAGTLVRWAPGSGSLPHAYSAGRNTSWSSVMFSSCQTPRAPRVRWPPR